MDEFLNEIEKENIGRIEYDVSLAKYTTYRVGGKACAIFYPKNVESLISFIRKAKRSQITYKVYHYLPIKVNKIDKKR